MPAMPGTVTRFTPINRLKFLHCLTQLVVHNEVIEVPGGDAGEALAAEAAALLVEAESGLEELSSSISGGGEPPASGPLDGPGSAEGGGDLDTPIS